MLCTGLHHYTEMFDIDIDRARHKSRFTGNGQRQRIHGIIDRAERRRFSALAEFRCRTVLAFCQTVDTIVEENIVDIEVTPDRMNEVIAANR